MVSSRLHGCDTSFRKLTLLPSVGENIGSIDLEEVSTWLITLANSTHRTTRSRAAWLIRSSDNRSSKGTNLVTEARVLAAIQY